MLGRVAESNRVIDGNIATGSDIMVDIDATYAFVGMDYGERLSQELADGAEYVRWTEPDDDLFEKVGCRQYARECMNCYLQALMLGDTAAWRLSEIFASLLYRGHHIQEHFRCLSSVSHFFISLLQCGG